jgi:two-component system, cell cycle sensor histidine kinase and response regulator CckA
MTPKATNKPPATRDRILLVDDEDLVRMMIRTVLGFRGYEVVEAEDGIDAVEKFRAASPGIDLVLMDYHLPRLNGREALLRIREIDPKVPAVIFSGGLHDGISDGGLEGVAFLHKPFENDELFRLVRELLDARGRAG